MLTQTDGYTRRVVCDDTVKRPFLVSRKAVLAEAGMLRVAGSAKAWEYNGDAPSNGLGAIECCLGGQEQALDRHRVSERACLPRYYGGPVEEELGRGTLDRFGR